MKQEQKNRYLLSPVEYKKIFNLLSAEYPRLFINADVSVLAGLFQSIPMLDQ